jgi:hypothetical protein
LNTADQAAMNRVCGSAWTTDHPVLVDPTNGNSPVVLPDFFEQENLNVWFGLLRLGL